MNYPDASLAGYRTLAIPYHQLTVGDLPAVTFPPFHSGQRPYVQQGYVPRTAQLVRSSPYGPSYALARRLAAQAASPYAFATSVQRYLAHGYTYNEKPPQRPYPLEGFLFRDRLGYCQQFSGAMALLLRMGGLPARVASGFTAGSPNASNSQWTVSDIDAHAWVEVWFPHYGWLPFDPTPGRGSLSAAYSVSSPDFRVAAAERIISGVASTLLNTAFQHQQAAFGEKEPGIVFHGTDIRPAKPNTGGPFGIQHRGGSLGKLLALVVALAIALLALAKAVRRQLRYATPDPRRQAAACRADLRDFLADQRIRVAPSAAPDELAALLRAELEVDASRFTAALAEARFAPPTEAEGAAARAREELTRLREQLRRRLGLLRRARGLVSLRSLGFTG
jgi:hypothetical protein